ncbi:MAG: hypothetical protein MR446_05755, partial [Bacteroidales bacterium]|nr:hypothetical protein [Bacteroidales bacterium]
HVNKTVVNDVSESLYADREFHKRRMLGCKDSARREEEKRKAAGFSFSYPELQPILSKVAQGERRRKEKPKDFLFSYPEPPNEKKPDLTGGKVRLEIGLLRRK